MANEIHLVGVSGSSVYAHILNSEGKRWNGAAFETFDAGNYSNYSISLAEDGATGVYLGTFPATITADTYNIIMFNQLGGSPANGDTPIGAQTIVWDGTDTDPEPEASTTSNFFLVGTNGSTAYAHIFNQSGQRWNATTGAFEAFNAANYDDYTIETTEDGNTSIFIGTVPEDLPLGSYDIVLFIQAGASPANGDIAYGAQNLAWNGSADEAAVVFGDLTGAGVRNYIVRGGWARDDMDTELYDALTDTILEMEQTFQFQERHAESTSEDSITALGEYKLDAQSNQGSIISVILRDGNIATRLRKISKPLYDTLYPDPSTQQNRGYPKHFTVAGNQVQIGPGPDDTSYTYKFVYSKRLLTSVHTSTDPVPYADKYRELLKDGTLARLFENLKQYSTADRWRGLFKLGMERAQKHEREDRGDIGCLRYCDY